jgi:hypothetical protein
MMKLPMKRKIVSSEKALKTTSVAASPSGRRGLEQRHQRHAEQRRDRDRDRLGDPPGHDEREDGCEPVLVRLEVERDQQDEREQERPEEQADCPPPALEALLGGGEPSGLGLLVERAVGTAAADAAVAVGSTLLLDAPFPRRRRHAGLPTRGISSLLACDQPARCRGGPGA